MRDLELAYDRLRDATARQTSTPSVERIVRRARRDTAVRLSAVGLMAALVIGGVYGIRAVGRGSDHGATVGHRPTASATPAATPTQAPPIPAGLLLYEGKQWTASARPGDLLIPVCGRKSQPFAGEVAHRTLSHGPRPPAGPMTNAKPTAAGQGEQLIVFSNDAAAKAAMAAITKSQRKCAPSHASMVRLRIGDEAFRGEMVSIARNGIQVVQKYVVTRKGRAIAIYWDYRDGLTRAPATHSQHERDARKMAGKLAQFG